MFSVTENACEACDRLLTEQQAPRGSCLRLELHGPRVVLSLASPVTDDTCLFHDERLVLTVAPESAEACCGFILDCDEDDDFVLRRNHESLN